ncbi:ribonuclease R [Algibacillus agarilyticus]|uniref:ribonuclease R n=1 Tax=Algibacillus agarilyticus TaxID=2234133 RepID=UPI0018E51640|nr:ribonuclease R [Algibacillus agarilyticus]
MKPTAEQSTPRTYENPIPDRDFILSLFNQSKKHLTREQIASELSLTTPEQKEALRRRLRAMERDGQLMFSKHTGFEVIDPKRLVSGVISIHPDGFGFVNIGEDEKDLFLPQNQISHVFDGDVVMVLLAPVDSNSKRPQNRLLKILEHKTTHIAGLLKKQGQDYILIPENNKITKKIDVDGNALLNAQVGEYVNAAIKYYPTYRQSTKVEITEVLGHPHSAGMETKLALRRHGVSDVWPDELISQAKNLGDKVLEQDKLSRVDYRALPFVTIDGADARDFDDAVYCQPIEQGHWQLLVAIADVSHYVKPDDVLDLEAQTRATSIYCPGKVIPMLPEALSNGLCSLNPHEDRLVLVCDMTINDEGIVIKSTFTEGVIHSHARLTYDQAYGIVARSGASLTEVMSESVMAKIETLVTDSMQAITPQITNLHTLYLKLLNARQLRGAIEFETQESMLNLDEQNKIESIEPILRNDAHRMIEECMLCANVATAQFLAEHKIPGLFRIHAGPQLKKLNALRAFLLEKGLELGGGDKPTPQHYNALLAKIDAREDARVIHTLLLRSQSQAEYSPSNQGHFGLAYDAYAHFTSPIRRYPDLITHRAIRAKIQAMSNGQKNADETSNWQRLLSFLSLDKLSRKKLCKKAYPYDFEIVEKLSAHCSEQSRKADDISREVDSALKCAYMEDFIGETYRATISGVTSFGFFVELDELGIDGLVPIMSFSAGEFVYDAATQKIADEDQSFALGDRVDVVLKTVDLRQRKMEFELL